MSSKPRPDLRLYVAIVVLAVLPACRPSTESSKYKYLQQGQTQIRVDERTGRTDRLLNNGWIPISFDSPSVEVPKEELKRISVTIVKDSSPPLCYTVDNDSAYVLKEVWVSLQVAKSNKPQPKQKDDVPLLLFLSSLTGGFAPVGNRFVMCYDNRDSDLTEWDTLSAEVEGAQGWKQ